MMADALFGALGKVGSPLKLVMVGTLAPMAAGPGHWWYDLIEAGTVDTTHVTAFRGDPAKWDKWLEIRRVNPLSRISAPFRRKLLSLRNEARRDPRLLARFKCYRLNIPSQDESAYLLSAEDWADTTARPVPDPDGKPVAHRARGWRLTSWSSTSCGTAGGMGRTGACSRRRSRLPNLRGYLTARIALRRHRIERSSGTTG